MTTRQKPLEHWSYEELVEYAEAFILKSFITEGGKGFHASIWTMLSVAIDWQRKQIKKGKTK